MKRVIRLIVEALQAEFGGRRRKKFRARSSRSAPVRRPRNPRCPGCGLFVSQLCPKACGFCVGCCPGHPKEDQR